MGTINVHQFVTLDGVIDAPTWSADYEFLPEMLRDLSAVTDRCDGILLGRTTYEEGEPAWSPLSAEDDPLAPFMNDTRKYVVSSTLTEASWKNSEILGAYDPDRIGRLKREVDGDVFVGGSGTLVRAMLVDDLVDELHLFVYPVTGGAGPRLFPEQGAPAKLSLSGCTVYEHGVVYLRYRT
jgi:dihydrofolate reductase